ncbi:MAG: transcription antitermination factor NusB [Synergistaceae bacterium]|nr:transcription antitermination factor NusB [Synergistaceae bacterium]
MPEKKIKIKKKSIGHKFEAIHRSRELAVQFLYSLDIYPEQDFNASLELFMNLDDVAKNDTPEVKKRCRDLSVQVWNRKNEIDSVLLRVVTGWTPDRMMSVDRTILRLMVLEGFLEKTLPFRSAITEAARLANDFGTKNSARFINGVMYKVEKFFNEDSDAVRSEE